MQLDNDKQSAATQAAANSNALTHGLYARDVVLPWESSSDFEALRADIRREFNPQGALEEHTVFDLTHLRWRKIRLHQTTQLAMLKDPFVAELVASGETTYSGLHQFAQNQSKSEADPLGLAHLVFDQLRDILTRLRPSIERQDDNEPERLRTLAKFADLMRQQVVPLIQLLEAAPSTRNAFRELCSFEHLQKQFALEATIDARIDKTLARLVHLQEYRRMNAARAPAALASPAPPELLAN